MTYLSGIVTLQKGNVNRIFRESTCKNGGVTQRLLNAVFGIQDDRADQQADDLPDSLGGV